ncbi:hypothetical protein HELRODRAFT_89226 [Helobdella robusta]|uniref:Glycoside hydrolase family 38 N-terminal domain-containing protein n=1 Tax=Helobdella robusta TaxID=6412 RepID=T1G7A6_HELRO|nr:hypothetical protein HELRODRAFT_89226 [Helobdella robusta]ESN93206.1 hypothetical protein HELRODRAFT_89226 [Helobdella robusta]
MYDFLNHIEVSYPSYLWSHTGWIENLDVFYDIDQWRYEKLRVHVVPFSHNDPGWKLTPDSYFSAFTKNILDIVLDKLHFNEEMTFTWSEVILLKRWYNSLSLPNKEKFKSLVRNGRFEIVTGGMVMVDEALVHYESMVDQLISGHQWIQKELNYKVKSAWSLDSFGHSPTLTYLLKKSGIQNLFIQRTHYSVKRVLSTTKKIEFNWITSKDESLFTHMSPFTLYSTSHSCGPDVDVCCQFDFTKRRCWQWGTYVDADEITNDNIVEKSQMLLDQLRKKVQFVNHNDVYLLVGDDFSFSNTLDWEIQWNNMLKLFNHMNEYEHYNVEFRFSTIGNYLRSAEAKLKGMNFSIPYLDGDFYPYSDRSDQYWSGFYSSRPFLKQLIRNCQSLVR